MLASPTMPPHCGALHTMPRHCLRCPHCCRVAASHRRALRGNTSIAICLRCAAMGDDAGTHKRCPYDRCAAMGDDARDARIAAVLPHRRALPALLPCCRIAVHCRHRPTLLHIACNDRRGVSCGRPHRETTGTMQGVAGRCGRCGHCAAMRALRGDTGDARRCRAMQGATGTAGNAGNAP